jgi:hypothetical protein
MICNQVLSNFTGKEIQIANQMVQAMVSFLDDPERFIQILFHVHDLVGKDVQFHNHDALSKAQVLIDMDLQFKGTNNFCSYFLESIDKILTYNSCFSFFILTNLSNLSFRNSLEISVFQKLLGSLDNAEVALQCRLLKTIHQILERCDLETKSYLLQIADYPIRNFRTQYLVLKNVFKF